MTPSRFLHDQPHHRSRQLRWVIPLAVLLGATVLTLALQYVLSGHEVQAEFFRAHKTISNTSQLLRRGMLVGSAVLLVAFVALGLWTFRMTHGIVRPVHTLHRALEQLAGGDLGVRVELHRHDEFQEVGVALNRLVDEFGETLEKTHALVDRIVALSEAAARDPHDAASRAELHEQARELDRIVEFFRLEPERVIRDEQA